MTVKIAPKVATRIILINCFLFSLNISKINFVYDFIIQKSKFGL